MKAPPYILRCIAIFFILIFSQKSGAGLYFHNLFHGNNIANEHPVKQSDKSKEFSYSCTCLDDLLMPFDGSEQPEYSSPVLMQIVPELIFEDRIPFNTSTFSFLRGPPAFKA
jgi:hypothetical protein